MVLTVTVFALHKRTTVPTYVILSEANKHGRDLLIDCFLTNADDTTEQLLEVWTFPQYTQLRWVGVMNEAAVGSDLTDPVFPSEQALALFLAISFVSMAAIILSKSHAAVNRSQLTLRRILAGNLFSSIDVSIPP